MNNPEQTERFGAKLLQHDESLSDAEYHEYRMKLEQTLARAERREKRAGVVAVVSFALALVLMFVGGSRLLGSFDPFDKNSTILSVTLGVIYCSAAVLFWVTMAAYFSRFRPQTREARDDLRDARILDIQRDICQLRRQIEAISQFRRPE